MDQTYPFVSIITVNYNGKKFVDDFFAGIAELDYPKNKIEVIYVDNGSSDGSVFYVKKEFPEAIIIENTQNNYARANNLGIKKSRGELVAFLNNDTKVEPPWLKELVAGIESEPRIGAVGSKILMMDGRVQSTGHTEYPDYEWRDRGFGEVDQGQYEIMAEMPSLCGASVLYRRACLDDVGAFDEDFNMFLEDVDMAKRCHDKKWSFLYVPKSLVHHHYHGVMTKELEEYYVQRNRLLIVAKHWPEGLPTVIATLRNYLRLKGAAAVDDSERMVNDLFIKLLKTHSRSKCIVIIPTVIIALREYLSQEVEILRHILAKAEKKYGELQASAEGAEESLLIKDKEIKEREELFKAALLDFQFLIQRQNAELCRANEALKTQDQNIRGREGPSEGDVQHFATKDETVRALQDEIAAVKTSAQAEVQEYARAITENNILITDLSKQLNAKELLFADLVKDIERERAALTDKANTLEGALNEKSSVIEELKGHCEKYETLLKEEMTRSELEHVTVIQELTKQLNEEKINCEREHVTVIQGLTEQLREKEETFRAKMHEFGQRMCELEEALKAKETELARTLQEMGQTVRSRDEQLQGLEETLQTMGHMLRSKEEQSQELEETLRTMGHMLRSKDELEQKMVLSLEEKERQLHDRDGELHNLDRILSERENEILRLNEQMAAFFTSRGYRYVLKPILGIVNSTKRLFRRRAT
jgi:GT2 family glycosyltransferase